MKVREVIFDVTESPEGGYEARALGYSIFTEGDDWDDLKTMARDAVLCHFDDGEAPAVIRLHLAPQEPLPSDAFGQRFLPQPKPPHHPAELRRDGKVEAASATRTVAFRQRFLPQPKPSHHPVELRRDGKVRQAASPRRGHRGIEAATRSLGRRGREVARTALRLPAQSKPGKSHDRRRGDAGGAAAWRDGASP